MSRYELNRRTFAASAAGIAAGVFVARSGIVAGQEATAIAGGASPEAVTKPIGYVSTRIRTLEAADARSGVNDLVVEQFAPEVEALPGFEGYLLGDIVDHADQSLSIVVFDEEAQTAAFDETAKTFVATLEDGAVVTGTEAWAGDLLIRGVPATTSATPAATPVTSGVSGYAAMRVHTSKPGTNPRDFVPLATTGFLPIVTALPGFQGYLWYPTDEGFVAISLYDSAESANASHDAAKEWAAEFLSEYTDGNPRIINANVVYTKLPVLSS